MVTGAFCTLSYVIDYRMSTLWNAYHWCSWTWRRFIQVTRKCRLHHAAIIIIAVYCRLVVHTDAINLC